MAAIDFGALMAAERARRRSESCREGETPRAVPMPPPLPHPSVPTFLLQPRTSRPALGSARKVGRVATVRHVGGWLSEEEEMELLDCVDNSPTHSWTQLRGRRLQQYGGTPLPSEPMKVEALPAWISSVVARVVDAGVFPPSLPPNHVLLNEYLPGQGIDPHRDGPLYHPLVAIISMGSHCTFQFVTDDLQRQPQESFLLPSRGLFLFEGDAYEKLLHTVPAKDADVMSNELIRLDLLSSEWTDRTSHADAAGGSTAARRAARSMQPRVIRRLEFDAKRSAMLSTTAHASTFTASLTNNTARTECRGFELFDAE
ncbi:MAG: hypothetical protein SGPRY_007067 [Prymnesium sp.]